MPPDAQTAAPLPESYEGAALVVVIERLDIVRIDLPGTILHGHTFTRATAKQMVDWLVHKNADPDYLPPPYKSISAMPPRPPAFVEDAPVAPAPPAPPPAPVAPPPPPPPPAPAPAPARPQAAAPQPAAAPARRPAPRAKAKAPAPDMGPSLF